MKRTAALPCLLLCVVTSELVAARAGAEPTKVVEATTKPGEAKPAEAKSAEAKPAEAKPAEAKPAEAKPAEADSKATATAKPTAAALTLAEEALALKAREILDSRCLFCHGEDPEGGLRVDSRAALLKGGHTGPAIVPGSSEESLLVKAVRRSHIKPMPPKTTLPEDEIATLVAWIAAGAPWRDEAPNVAGAKPAAAKEKLATAVPLRGLDGAGPVPLRRLTSDEYLATVRALFGAPVTLPFPLPEDAAGANGFVSAAVVSAVEAGRFLAAAEALSAAASKRMGLLLPCDPATVGEDACARAFIEDFGRKAFRRPVSPDEAARLFARYRSARRSFRLDFEGGIRLLIAAVLVSPQFLYHDEGGPRTPRTVAAVVPLTPHEIAARLSYFLTGGPPDEALAAAADAGTLRAPEQVAAHARRLLESGRADKTVATFHAQWLHLDHVLDLQKDGKIFKDFNPKLVQAMEKETQTFIHHVFFEDGKLDALLLAPYSFINERLAKLYGIMGVKGDQFRLVELDPNERAGVLTQGSFLATLALPNTTSPVKRGKTIMQDLLCMSPPPPPAGLDAQPPKPNPKAQTRELYKEHSENKVCRSCHEQMDPIGFAFESYDAIGRFRKEEAGRPVDTTGTLHGLAAGDRPFKNARELVRTIAQSDEAKRCVVKKWVRFALGRNETAEESSSLDEVYGAFEKADWDMRELVVAITTSRAFLNRVEPGAHVAQN